MWQGEDERQEGIYRGENMMGLKTGESNQNQKPGVTQERKSTKRQRNRIYQNKTGNN